MFRSCSALVGLVALAALTCRPARAQSAAEPAPPADDEEPAAAPEAPRQSPPSPDSDRLTVNPNDTTYKGVAPGGVNLPPHPPKLPITKGPQRLTWSGFQLKDGVPTVFLELTSAPDYQVAETPGQLVVTLKNTVAPLKNNRRPLRVAYFNTPVKDVETKAKGHDLRVTIHLSDKQIATHREHVEPAAGGFQLLLIEIGR